MAELSGDKLKKGGYSVHVYLQAGRGLLSVGDKNNVDPVVLFRVFGKAKCTKAQKKITTGTLVSWDDHFYFEKEITSPVELERERLVIEVRDEKLFLKDSLIGVYELDLTFIYYQENHCILNKWVVLSNPESEDFSTVRGYLRISASVLHEGDKPVDLTVPFKVNEKEDLMIPPQIKLQTKQLHIQFFRAEALPVMDSGGTVDAYCVARFGGVEGKTSWKTADKATMSVDWSEEILLPVVIPSVGNKLSITVLDYDRLSKEDDMVGSFSFDWNKVSKGDYNRFFWVNIYGGPENLNNDQSKLMNSVTELASNWRGRALMRIFLEDNPRAILKTQKILKQEDLRKVREEYSKGKKWEIRAKVFNAVALPTADKVSILIKWGDLLLETGKVTGVNGCADWYELIDRKMTEIPEPNENNILPDVFIYLRRDNKNICFTRIPAQEFFNVDTRDRWEKFTPDRAINEVKNDWEGGYIKFQVYIGLFKSTPIEDFWKVKPEKIEGRRMNLVCNIFQCRSLPPSDASGLADPYVVVYHDGRTISTDKKAKEQTLNPIWYENYSMDVDFVGVDKSSPIIVYVMDYDLVGSDDMMGMTVIGLDDKSLVRTDLNSQEAQRPRWLPLGMGKPGTEQGEILISFNLLNEGTLPEYDLRPITRDFTFEINVLGLRDLKPSLGWMPVNKAFCKFDLKSLEMPGESQMITELKTQPFEPGANPNINTVLSFTTKIPVDHLFAPALTCNVHDYLLMGLSQPLLGTFYIKLGDIIRSSRGLDRPETEVMNIQYSRANPFLDPQDKALDDSAEEGLFQRRLSGAPVYYRQSMVDPSALAAMVEKVPEAKFSAYKVKSIKIEPQFEDDSRLRRKVEINKPDSNLYVAIGYNRVPEDGLKHYRHFIEEELEKTDYIGKSPFNIYEIQRGQSRGLDDGFISSADKIDEAGQKTNSRVVGIFKGMIRVVNENEEESKKNLPKIIGANGEEENDKEVEEQKFFKNITKQLLIRTECVVRVYILNCIDLAQRDVDSPSDPYIILKIGKKKLKDRENYKLDDANPDFYKSYELTTTLPGDSMLKLELWDYDEILPDSKIGSTKIDLEDRYFSYTWNKLESKPIETRKLYIKSSRVPQGSVRMWIEIHPSKNRPDPIDITPKPPLEYEARLIVWKSEKVPSLAIEGVSDLYLRAWVSNQPAKETDTHYRCQRGNASWNWRLKFPVLLDGKGNYELMLQLWDRDFFSANAFIGDASINFTDIAQEAWEFGTRVQKTGNMDLAERLTRKEIPKFWVEFKSFDKNGKENKAGRVQVSFELVPGERAKACPVGEGRSEPNIDPPLPKPDSRMEWSMNPMKMMSQMCGPDVRTRFCMWISLALCIVLLIMMFPMIVSNAITTAIFS